MLRGSRGDRPGNQPHPGRDGIENGGEFLRRLLQLLHDLDGKPYGQLRRIYGDHADRDMALVVDHVQGDPYANASRLHLELPPQFHPNLALPQDAFERLAMEDLFLREFARRLPEESLPAGDGGGGRLRTARPDATIRPRSAAQMGKLLTLRFSYAFPAQNRRILAEPVAEVLANRLPALALDIANGVTRERILELAQHLRKRQMVREAMSASGIVAFLPEGSCVRREESGAASPKAVRLALPTELSTTLSLADGSTLSGLAIRKGVTVLVGSAFHGKTTFLEALETCRADVGPSDGLALACSTRRTETVTVEEDRRVGTCDLSPFFRRLPGQDPSRFSVDEASGATSQAANLVESLTCGSELLLIDEDASAANFLTRDPIISRLLPEGESVVPLADRCAELDARGVSMVVVAGASSQWLSVADQVMVLARFQPQDATAKARTVAPVAGEKPPACDWDVVLGDQLMEQWKELASVPATKLKVQDGIVRFAKAAESRLPRRFASDDTLRGAAHLLCQWMRHCRDRNLPPTRKGLVAYLDERRLAADPWGHAVGHDLAFPTGRESWALWTRMKAGSGEAEDED
ncbi:MAG TPA: ABC-ATPase domain-containing protein [Fibrobacteria bacterium]|nr:ABC-ATPase domain-containing protein [Fibrobacteria bacterium]